MDYTHLSESQALQLRHQRILDLEIEHYKVRMVLEERPEDPKAPVDLAEIERRIDLHRGVLGIVVPPLDGVEPAAPGEPDTPGSGDEAPTAAKAADAGPMTNTDTYEDGPHEGTDAPPAGLETKSVAPEFASTTAHQADGAEHDAAGPAGGVDEIAGGPEDGHAARVDHDGDAGDPPRSV